MVVKHVDSACESETSCKFTRQVEVALPCMVVFATCYPSTTDLSYGVRWAGGITILSSSYLMVRITWLVSSTIPLVDLLPGQDRSRYVRMPSLFQASGEDLRPESSSDSPKAGFGPGSGNRFSSALWLLFVARLTRLLDYDLIGPFFSTKLLMCNFDRQWQWENEWVKWQ